jgi:uncharacterized membrane protein
VYEELIEDPNDFVAIHLLSIAQNFTVGTQHFYAFYLLSHGVVKVFLVIGLLRNKLWAYPVSLVVLGLFIVYQLYRFVLGERVAQTCDAACADEGQYGAADALD